MSARWDIDLTPSQARWLAEKQAKPIHARVHQDDDLTLCEHAGGDKVDPRIAVVANLWHSATDPTMVTCQGCIEMMHS